MTPLQGFHILDKEQDNMYPTGRNTSTDGTAIRITIPPILALKGRNTNLLNYQFHPIHDGILRNHNGLTNSNH